MLKIKAKLKTVESEIIQGFATAIDKDLPKLNRQKALLIKIKTFLKEGNFFETEVEKLHFKVYYESDFNKSKTIKTYNNLTIRQQLNEKNFDNYFDPLIAKCKLYVTVELLDYVLVNINKAELLWEKGLKVINLEEEFAIPLITDNLYPIDEKYDLCDCIEELKYLKKYHKTNIQNGITSLDTAKLSTVMSSHSDYISKLLI